MKSLYYIFTRPILAALVVGTIIHLLFLINSIVFNTLLFDTEWFMYRGQLTPYFIVKTLIPYLVPYTVSHIGRQIVKKTNKELMIQFPESNPDIVIQLDAAGDIKYTNSAASEILNRLNIHIDELLTSDTIKQQLEQGNGNNTIIEREVKGYTFSLNFKPMQNGELFISGRDITSERRLQLRLNNATEQLQSLITYLDQTMDSYDPMSFDIDRQFQKIIELLLTDDGEGDDYLSLKHIFMVIQDQQKRGGYIYHLQNGHAQRDPQYIEIKPDETSYAISYGNDEVVWKNWEDEAKSIEEFQSQFNPDVRAAIGTIERFVTYRSGSITIIAFYSGAKINQYNALVLKGLTVFAQSINKIAAESRKTEEAFIYTLNALARASEANDEDTGSHIIRINKYSKIIAEQMGLDEQFVKNIHYSAQMHDVGKIHIHPNILKKPGSLTDDEFREMQQHPYYGAKILGDSPRMKMASEIALYHHEKFNGGGYPNNLKGENIPLSARIVSLADIYDALRQKRVYKPAFPHEKAYSIITEGDGRTMPEHFDPQVLSAFKKVHDKMDQVFNSFQD